MKIGYDAKRAVANFTGLGNYSRYIINGVAAFSKQNELRLYIPKKKENREYLTLLECENVCESLPKGAIAKKFSSLWRSFSITRQIKNDKIDIYHGLSNELPFGIAKSKTKSIVTIHDLIFLRLPHCYNFFDRLIYNFKFKYACQKSNKIVAVSQCTKRDIVSLYGIAPDKIDVIYQGCNIIFKNRANYDDINRIKERYNLPQKFILNVGSIEERKNLFLVIKSLSSLPDDLHIVAVGKRTKYSDMIMKYVEENNLSSRVHLLHKVSFEDLPVLYQCAEIFAYPSFYEGFGIPIIEAINSHLPVIAAKGSCLEEAGGDGALYINPNSVGEFSDAAIKLLNDKKFKDTVIRRGLSHIERFEDEKLAQQMVNLYSNLK